MPDQDKLKKIVLTGGGTAGHVMLHMALLPEMKSRGWQISYIGTNGIEKGIIEGAGLAFYTVAAGKLRRYFSIQNFFDIFKLFYGVLQCIRILLLNRPHVVFSKGGFVSVPTALAAWLLRIPVITHESDVTPGLANKLLLPFSKKMLYSFPETNKFLPNRKSEFVGSVVREELMTGDRIRGLKYCGFSESDERPILLFSGGSQGAQKINDVLSRSLEQLTKNYRIVHLAGKGKTLDRPNDESYVGFEFVSAELKDVFAVSDLVVSRAGANSIFEFLALKKPMLLIPLVVGSRGDQLVNAKSFKKNNWARILAEKKMNPDVLLESIEELSKEADEIREAQKKHSSDKSKNRILEVIESFFGT